MPLDPELVRDSLYDESGLYFDEVLAIDRERNARLVVRYAFLFEQSGVPVYQGDQTAVWNRL